MPQDPDAQFDVSVLEKIEQSPIGAVAHTPAYQDALKRLYSSHQVYADADHKGGHVTARSLAGKSYFHASNLEDFVQGRVPDTALETNASIFERYVKSLGSAQQAAAAVYRQTVPGKPVHHRKHSGVSTASIHDPVHSLFLIPGSGPHPGLPGNYLYGFLHELGGKDGKAAWSLIVHDNLDGVEMLDCADLAQAMGKLEELFASAPFHLEELGGLGFVAG